MKPPFISSPDDAPPAAEGEPVQRARPLSEQFPAPTAPTAFVFFAGLVVLVAGLALMGRAWMHQDATVTASTGRNAAPVEATEDVSADRGAASAGAAKAAAPAAEAPVAAGREPESGAAERARSVTVAPAANDEPKPAARATVEEAPTWWLEQSDATTAPPASPESGSDQPSVAVAETVDEVLALEAIQRREVEADLAEPSAETTAAVPQAGPKVAATATTWVNLRAGPSDDAEVLLVVPGNARIEAESGCNWCAVSYDGRDGYIYKNFISYE